MARVVFQPGGTTLHKEALRIRLDIFPEPGEKAYTLHSVSVPMIPDGGYSGARDREGNPADLAQYQAWLGSLPYAAQVNPYLCQFVRIGPDITLARLEDWINTAFTPAVLATLDEAVYANSLRDPGEHYFAHVVAPYMRSRGILSPAKVTRLDDQDRTEINSRLAGLIIDRARGSKSDIVIPRSIDVGPGCADRAVTAPPLYTFIDITNPANDTGTLSTMQVWLYATASNHGYMGTFYGSGTTYTNRDYEDLGTSIAAGSTQTFNGLDCDVSTGDYLGWYGETSLEIERDNDYSSYYYANANYMGAGPQSYTLASPRQISIYATGTETGGSTIPIFMHHYRQNLGG